MPDDAQYFAQMQSTDGWRAILASFARFVEPAAKSQLLDVGCGAGALVSIFQADYGSQAFGVDMDVDACQIGQRMYSGGVQLAVGVLPRLPYAAATFDVITATNLLYLLDDPLAALHGIARVLKSGGQFAMLNPSGQMNQHAATALADERGLTGFARQNFIHWGQVAEVNHRFSVGDVEHLFAQVGLQLIETRLRIGQGLALYAKGQKS